MLFVMETAPGDVTALLIRIRGGEPDAVDLLVPMVYSELRRLASHMLRRERDGHTLQPTALVHEAYFSLVKQENADWRNKSQFMAIAAQAMRRILLQYARRRRAAKRVMPEGAGLEGVREAWEEILAVDAALERLAELSPQQARITEMRYFGGLSVEETAEVLEISPRTVKREWAVARGFLHAELSGWAIE